MVKNESYTMEQSGISPKQDIPLHRMILFDIQKNVVWGLYQAEVHCTSIF